MVGDVAVHPLPYLEPALTADALGASDRTHAGVMRAAMGRSTRTPGPGAVATVIWPTPSSSGDDERVGARHLRRGVSGVAPEVFAGVDYTALGHLHGRQEVAERVRYSGSPVAMSFGEWRHTKGSLLVDLTGPEAAVEHIPAPVQRPLAVLRGTLDELLADPAHVAAEGAWCQVTLTDPVRPLGAMDRVRRRFPHTLELRLDPQGASVPLRPYAARTSSRSDVEVCCDFLAHVRGGRAATDDEVALLGEAVEASRVDRAVGDDEGAVRVGAGGASGSVGAA